MSFKVLLYSFFAISLFACQKAPRFIRHTDAFDFVNLITEDDTTNVLDFSYLYNGGGVGVGDFDKDGLPDIFFAGNQVSSKLFLNQGNLQFEDITTEAKVTTDAWVNGVSVVDINNDGWLDIYLSVGGMDCRNKERCRNLLFVNNAQYGTPTFREQASLYGLADTGYNQQTLFFDLDDDGDLDAYLLRNTNTKRNKNLPTSPSLLPESSSDRLMENLNQNGKIVFKEVGTLATKKGYGLGIAATDFNKDGRTDIYVANDFISDDFLWINTDTGLIDKSNALLMHTSYNAMGVELADLNNDGYDDIISLDMLPNSNQRLKSMQGFMNYQKYQLAQRQGYNRQFVKNTVQLNNYKAEDSGRPFSEVAELLNMSATDWSWAPLAADFDNDADRDVFITNGYGKDITDLDFISYTKQQRFGAAASRDNLLRKVLSDVAYVPLQNHFFEQKSYLEFEDVSKDWLSSHLSISSGSIYADLDLDGDLDIVTNNINEQAFLLENTASQEGSNFLSIQLKGPKLNRSAYGSTITVWSNGTCQTAFFNPVRGYLSSVSQQVHFGLGDFKVDSLVVLWPNSQYSVKRAVDANQHITIDFEEEVKLNEKEPRQVESPLFAMDTILKYEPARRPADFEVQHLLISEYSAKNAKLSLSKSDDGKHVLTAINSDQNTWVFNNVLDTEPKCIPFLDSLSISGLLSFDIDNDGKDDWYVASGGYQVLGSKDMCDRVFMNKGDGVYEESNQLLCHNSSIVLSSDFNQDGWNDIFVGGGVAPGRFPNASPSSILLNDKGRLQEDTSFTYSSSLGIISDAVLSDFNKDGQMDIITVSHWGDISFLANYDGVFVLEEPLYSLNGNPVTLKGIWNTIHSVDIDGDGDQDFLLGNQGLNSRLRASQDFPLKLVNADVDGNGSPDPIIGLYNENTMPAGYFPLHSRDDILSQVVNLKRVYTSYKQFGEARFQDLLSHFDGDIPFFSVNILESVLLRKVDNGYQVEALPLEAQFSPILDIETGDINGDAFQDILLVSNDMSAESTGGTIDAGGGMVFYGNQDGQFFSDQKATRFCADGSVSRIIQILPNKIYGIAKEDAILLLKRL